MSRNVRVERQVAFWLSGLAFLAFSLWLLGGVLLPFVAGLILGYLLDPVADRLQRLGLNRLGATIVILALFILALLLILFIAVPILGRQLGAFIENLPGLVSTLQNLLTTEGGRLADKYVGSYLDRLGLGSAGQGVNLQQSIGDIVGQGAQWLLSFGRSLWSGGQALIGVFSLLVVTPVVAFYMLLDWDRLVTSIDSWTPLQHRATVRQLAREIDAALSGFLHGQSLVCGFLALWYAVGLSLIGLNFGFLIGISGGILSFIPYVGSLTALVLASGVAIVQGWPDWTLLLLTFAVVMSGQFLEGNVLSPWLVGSSIGLHPVWVMFSLLAFGTLFGFTGLILGVPVAAAIGVLTRFALRRYLASELYRGVADEPADGPTLVVERRIEIHPVKS